jgi:molybdate transport system ATP-binding protein
MDELSYRGASRGLQRTVTNEQIALISFEHQQKIFEEQVKLAANDFLSDADTATRAHEFLPDASLSDSLIDTLNLRHRLNARYTELSTGESRKLLVLAAIFRGVELLILDNPFDSLDQASCTALSETLAHICERGVTIVLLLSNRQDIPSWCAHMAVVDSGQFTVLAAPQSAAARERIAQALQVNGIEQPDWPPTAIGLQDYPHRHLVALDQCNVSYGGSPVLSDLSLTVEPLQHTLITGANGSGKSTLLGLITGDCPQCYSNDVTVLGYRRGQGESIWDIKANMGIVSNDLHRRYRVHCTVETAVISGFFDSIGVYEKVSDQQRAMARQWLTAAGLVNSSHRPLQEMSYGEQRLVLIARALVKSPLLLILDEPTQGLDELNRHRLLQLLEVLAQRRHTTVLFVSHREDEYLDLFKQRLHLERPT